MERVAAVERIDLYMAGQCCGEVLLQARGQRMEICAAMQDPKDGLYRAALVGQTGERPLGVMEPEQGRLCLRRTVLRRDIELLGTLLRGEAYCSFRFEGSAAWNAGRCPEPLLRDPFLRQRLHCAEQGWWRQDGDRLYLALPAPEGAQFPLETLFCFAQIRRVEGIRCAVYCFDSAGRPVFF